MWRESFLINEKLTGWAGPARGGEAAAARSRWEGPSGWEEAAAPSRPAEDARQGGRKPLRGLQLLRLERVLASVRMF
jgi:hypothetical protein